MMIYPITISRYCKACHRVTKHSYDGKKNFRCLSTVHKRNVARQRQNKKG